MVTDLLTKEIGNRTRRTGKGNTLQKMEHTMTVGGWMERSMVMQKLPILTNQRTKANLLMIRKKVREHTPQTKAGNILDIGKPV